MGFSYNKFSNSTMPIHNPIILTFTPPFEISIQMIGSQDAHFPSTLDLTCIIVL